MKDSLIGEEIRLVGTAGDVSSLVLETAAAFLEAADGDPPEPDAWRPDLAAALASLGSGGDGQLEAILQTTADGIQVLLRLPAEPERESSFLCNL